MQTITLEKLKIGFEQILSEEILEPHAEVYRDHLSNQLRLQLRGYVWAEDVGTAKVKYPRDWWQHFKERWFPKWALDKWPVVYTHKSFNAKVIYPDYKVAIPNQEYRHRIFVDEWATPNNV